MAPCAWSAVPTFGVQVSVCGLEFSAFYGPECPACGSAADFSARACVSTASSSGLPEWLGGGTASALASTSARYHPWRPPPLTESASSPVCFLYDRVRTTSVILLLGVGSFVCYKLYCQLRQRFRRRRKSKREAASLNRSYVENWISGIEQKGIQGCYVDSDNESDISDASLPDTSQASFGDIPKPVTEHAEAEKQCDGSSSCGGGGFLSDDEFLDMGVGSSNPYEPVRFDSHSGDVCFQGCPPPKASTPLNIAPKNQNNGGGGGGSFRLRNRKAKLDDSQPPRQSKQSQKDTSVKTGGGGGGRLGDFKASVKNNNNNDEDRAPLSDDSISQDPESLLDSLSYEGGGEASTPWANDSVSLLANFSIGSLSERNRRTEELISSRVDSQGEETDDFSLAGGMVSDSALLRLRSSHSRQLSADSEASDLSIFERAQAPLEVPCETFETIDKLETVLHDTKQELLDLDADLVSLRVFRKLPANYDVVLEDVNKKNIDALVHRGSVRDSDMHPDSGSDFGNSLESDSERLAKHSSGPSLEWDSLPISRCFSEQERQHESDSTDFGGFSEFSESEDGAEPQSVLGVVRRHSSGNIHNAGTLRQQIQRILYEESESWKRHLVRSQTLPVDQSLPEADRTLVPITREPVSLNKITTVPEENTPSPSSVSDFASLAASSDRDTSMDTNGNDLRDMLKDDGLLELESAESAELLACVEDKVSLADYIMGLRHKRRHQSGNGMEKSLAAVLSGLEVRSLRRIKNDGCAAIRAAGFQILASGGSILAGHRGANGVYQRFHDSASSPGAKPWLEGWAFHHSLRGVHTLQGFWECLSLLQDLEDQLRLTATPEALLARKLNADPLADAKFVEAIKILMLKSALELFAKQKDSDTPCPLFATVLFSQVTLTSPEEYLVNHISRLGRDRAIPEAELYLLGYALETTLTVVRPSCSGNEDIVSRYPEWQVGSWPEAVLLEHKGHLWACAT